MNLMISAIFLLFAGVTFVGGLLAKTQDKMNWSILFAIVLTVIAVLIGYSDMIALVNNVLG